ncbi:MAG: dehypoxanthine futalosine cyclase [Candidatus Obscuribacterales bacterium]|nr:dehypoxanthine futalosine cyclase [Candidatus Obscuribacterales bacterium]
MVTTLLKEAATGRRLTVAEAARIYREASLLDLAWAANEVKRRFHKDDEPITFVIDRNVNYTNVCNAYCQFCAFYAAPGSNKAYVLPYEQIKEKIKELIALGGTQLLLQGGHNPELGIEYYEELLGTIRRDFPNLTLHALSPSEIDHITRVSNLSLEKTLERLIAAGLSSIPGGGAEILVERVKDAISPLKMPAARWLEVMECAQKMGLKTSATMMYGTVETIEERIEHLIKLRDLQDKTNGFTAFITWSFQPGGTPMARKMTHETTAVEYLRMVAIGRLVADNIPNVQTSWVTQGLGLGQAAFAFGANDFGGTMMEENVVSAAGTYFDVSLKQMIEAIHAAGHDAAQRDTQYNLLKTFPRKVLQPA